MTQEHVECLYKITKRSQSYSSAAGSVFQNEVRVLLHDENKEGEKYIHRLTNCGKSLQSKERELC